MFDNKVNLLILLFAITRATFVWTIASHGY